jgi:hypothetical protein
MLSSPSNFDLLQQRNRHQLCCRRLLLFVLLQCSEKGDDNNAFLFLFCCNVAKKATTTNLPSPFIFFSSLFCCSVQGDSNVTFYFHFAAVKKATIMSRHLLLWFHCSGEKEDDSFRQLFLWLYYKKNGDLPLFL